MLNFEIPVYDKEGNLKEDKVKISLEKKIRKKDNLISEVIRREESNKRVSTADTKTKGKVRGGGIKPWRQKGTGRARAGSIRSPLWKGGGVIFGPTKEKNYTKKINKKMRQNALVFAIFDKIKENKFFILETPSFKKTKEFYEHIYKIIGEENKKKREIKIVYFVDQSEKNVGQYISNINKLKVLFSPNLKDIVWADILISSPSAFKNNVEKRLNVYESSRDKKSN